MLFGAIQNLSIIWQSVCLGSLSVKSRQLIQPLSVPVSKFIYHPAEMEGIQKAVWECTESQLFLSWDNLSFVFSRKSINIL